MRRIIAFWSPLFTAHMDAWGLTLIIAVVCTLLHDAASADRSGLLLTLTVTCWLAFAVNDYFDAPYDALDDAKRQRNFFATRHLSQPLLVVLLGIIVFMLTISYASYGWRGLLVYAILLIATWAYSTPPLRLKSRPGVDLVIHGVFVQTAPYFVCLFLLGSAWIELDYLLLIGFFLSSLAAQLEQQTRDYEVDSLTEGNSTTLLGRRTAVLLMRGASAGVLILLLVAIIGRLVPLFIVPFVLICLPVILHRFLRRADEPRSQRLIVVLLIVALLYTGGIWSAAVIQNSDLFVR
ncbi:MAG: UbiA family prenyltransferase [Anaerolineae bacterium]|nr:UbiA family prenyltransferase [Anaerolineae bacterium]